MTEYIHSFVNYKCLKIQTVSVYNTYIFMTMIKALAFQLIGLRWSLSTTLNSRIQCEASANANDGNCSLNQ